MGVAPRNNRAKGLGVTVTILFLAGSLAVQAAPRDDTSQDEKPYWRRNLFSRSWADQKYLFTTWLPSEARRPGFALPVFLGTGLALATSGGADGNRAELSIERDFHSDIHGYTVSAAHGFTTLGDAPTGALLIGTGYLLARWSGHDYFAETMSLSAEAVLDAGLWVTILKGVTARTRPTNGGNGNFFEYNHPSKGSFPSGHATCAFAAASVVAGMYRGEHKWVPWVAYGTATLVGASRVALGRHFTSDVFVGAFIGDSFGRMVLSRRLQESGSATSTFQPFYDPAQRLAGVAWSREW
jgi:PAP2 superfamily